MRTLRRSMKRLRCLQKTVHGLCRRHGRSHSTGISGSMTGLAETAASADAAYVRSHSDGMEVAINDAPCADEIMVAVAITFSGRPLPRVGGLVKDEIKGTEGLR